MSLKSLTVTFKQRPRWVRISTYFITAYLFYAIQLGIVIPIAVESFAPNLLADKLGRHVTIDKIQINPFLLRARMSGFIIEEAQESENFIAIDALEVDLGFWQTILGFTPTVEHIYLTGPYAHLVRISANESTNTDPQLGTRFNFTDIIETIIKNSNEEAKNSDEAINEQRNEIPHIRIGEFRLTQGFLALSDNVTNTQLDYPALSFTLTDLDTLATNISTKEDNATRSNLYEFSLATAHGGSIDFSGQFQLTPLDVAGKFEATHIALAPLWPLSDDVIDAKVTDGHLNFLLNYRLTEDEDNIRFQATHAGLSLSQLVISDGTIEKIRIGNLDIKDINLDTKTQRIDIASMKISDPWLSAFIDETGVDLVSMFSPKGMPDDATTNAPASQASTVTEDDNSTGWQAILQGFELANADISIQENILSSGVHWRVFPLNMATGKVESTLENPIDYTLDMKLGGNPTQRPESPQILIATQGAVDANSQNITGSLAIHQFALSQIQPYVTPYVNVTLQKGSAGVEGTFEASSKGAFIFDGNANISSLTLLDNLKQEPLLQWDKMEANGIQFNAKQQSLSLQTLSLDKPYAKLLISEQKQTNFSDIVKSQPTNSQTGEIHPTSSSENLSAPITTENTPSTLSVAVDEVSINDGSAYFADNSLRPRFASGIEQLNGSITALSSVADTTANVDISGKIDGYAPVSLKGTINPLIEDIFLNLRFRVEGAELTSVNPYSGTYMGHFIDKGLLSLDIEYLLENNQLAGNNHVVIDQLTLGRKTNSDQALSLPLGLAIALLEDADGVIDLGLEVTGDLNNPTFGFGSIILKAIGNVITKAVTAPFSLLANLVGSEDDELNEIAFSNGSSTLTESAKDKLLTLSNALAKRPGLRVNIEGSVDEVSDAFELAEQKLHQQLLELSEQHALPQNLSGSTMPITGPIADALATLFTRTTGKTMEEERLVVTAQLKQHNKNEDVTDETSEQTLVIAMYNQVHSNIKITRRELTNLATERAKTVKSFMVNHNEVDANRLFLLNSREHLQTKKSGVALTLEAN